MGTAQLTPAEQLKRDIASTRSELTQLVDKVKLTSVRDAYSTLDSAIANLPLRVQKVRARNYAFNKFLESQVRDFQRQWSLKRSDILNQITSESNSLQNQLRPLETRGIALSNPMVVKALQADITGFKSRVSASERAVTELFDDIKNEVNKVQTQLNQVEKTLDLAESASFGFLPTESVVRAVNAVWTRDEKEDKDDPEGTLFLTDQRLLFEQREEIATKKVLFVTTERKKVQQLLFEVPVFSIASVQATKQGMMKNEDWITLEFESGAFARNAKLHLDGQDCNEWQKLITRVKAREFDFDRAIAIDSQAAEKAKAAPVICPHCGGSLTKPVLRGMDSIKCDFCGNLIKL